MQSDVARRPGVQRVAVGSLIAIHVMLAAWCAGRFSPTLDEPAHLAAGIGHWTFGRFEFYRVNPPLTRLLAAAPLAINDRKVRQDWSGFFEQPGARPEFTLGQDLIKANGKDFPALLREARWACLPLSVLGAISVGLFARGLFGPVAGLLALVLWTFSPGLIAHGALVTPDRAAASCGIIAACQFWRWLRHPGWSQCCLAGVGLGLALLAKASWLILLVLWPVLGVTAIAAATITGMSRGAGARTMQLAGILVSGLYLVNLGYGFEGPLVPLKDFVFVSHSLSGSPSVAGNRFEKHWLGALPVPLPREYMLGIDLQRRDFEQDEASYLLGTWSPRGWWFYYCVGAFVKWPTGLWGLLGLAAFAGIRRLRGCSWHGMIMDRAIDGACLCLPPAVLFLLAASQTSFSHHFRYVLPVEPFVIVMASSVLSGRCGRVMGRLVQVSTVMVIAECLATFPHELSFYNTLAGGPQSAGRLMLGSNTDWGQDVDELARWAERHPDAHPLFVAVTRPGPAWELPNRSGSLFPRHPDEVPGWYALSVNFLNGETNRAPPGADARFLTWPTVQRIGYTIVIFRRPSGPGHGDTPSGQPDDGSKSSATGPPH